jgi:hypothetical protein
MEPFAQLAHPASGKVRLAMQTVWTAPREPSFPIKVRIPLHRVKAVLMHSTARALKEVMLLLTASANKATLVSTELSHARHAQLGNGSQASEMWRVLPALRVNSCSLKPKIGMRAKDALPARAA